MECGNCGFFNAKGELLCEQCSAAVQSGKSTQRSTYALFFLLTGMISLAIIVTWLRL